MRRTASFTILLALASPVAADELRVSYGFGAEEFKFTPPALPRDEFEWDENRRIEISVWGAGQTLIGFALQQQIAEVDEPTWQLDYESYAFRLYTGTRLAQTQSFGLEVTAFTSIGLAEARLNDGITSDSDDEWYFDYGVQAAANFSPSYRWTIGASAGYLISEAEFSLLGRGRAVDQRGIFYNAFVGFRF